MPSRPRRHGHDPHARPLPDRLALAGRERISLRTGCFCNPGAGETAEGLTEEDMRAGLADGTDMTLPRFLQIMLHRDQATLAISAAPFDIESCLVIRDGS